MTDLIGVADVDKARGLVFDALHTDGEHHKQWYLEQIGKALGMDMNFRHVSTADSSCGGWEKGIAP